MRDEVTIAAIQARPVFMDREASTDKACRLIREAGEEGVQLAAFGESWLPGYPVHAWNPMAGPQWWEAAADYLDQAVAIPSPSTDRLCSAARDADIDVVIGIVEQEPRTRGSVYSTLLFIGREGRVLGRHRKLKPTAGERITWSDGDVDGLVVHERPYARISGLNCWEHQMPLACYALMAQGTQIHVATWPGSEPSPPEAPNCMWARQHLLSRAFAAQGACYVICAAGMLRPEDVPGQYREILQQHDPGDSVIIDPRGEIIAGPVSDEETILKAKVPMSLVQSAKVVCDNAGHYSRPELLQLYVNGRPVTAHAPQTYAGSASIAEEHPPHQGSSEADQLDHVAER